MTTSSLQCRLTEAGEQRVREREEHRERHADQERRVDEAGQQEHAGLQRGDQFRLAGGRLQELRAHDADADAGADGAQADDQAECDRGVALDLCDEREVFHLNLLAECAVAVIGKAMRCSGERSPLVVLGGHRGVHDGEHHEDERLQRDDQDVEDRPDGAHGDLAEEAERAAERQREDARAEQRDQHEHEFASVHVAEESHRERNGLREQFDEVQHEIRDPQHRVRSERCGEELVDVAARTLGLEAVEQDDEQHRQRHRERGVGVGGGHDAPVMNAEQGRNLAGQVERQQVHRVHQEHPHEDREGERGEEAAVEMKHFLDGGVDELDDHLDEGLPLAGDADGRLAGGRIEQSERDDAEQHRHEDRVDVERPEPFADLQVGQVVGDVLGAVRGTCGGVLSGGHCLYPLRPDGLLLLRRLARASRPKPVPKKRRDVRCEQRHRLDVRRPERGHQQRDGEADLHQPPQEEPDRGPHQRRAFAVPQHREGHQARRRDADSGSQQR